MGFWVYLVVVGAILAGDCPVVLFPTDGSVLYADLLLAVVLLSSVTYIPGTNGERYRTDLAGKAKFNYPISESQDNYYEYVTLTIIRL